MKRLLALFLACSMIFSVMPLISLSSSADNSGFGQIRVLYQNSTDGGQTWSSEQTAMISENGFLNPVPFQSGSRIRITRFLVRNDTPDFSANIYFQFDLLGGLYSKTAEERELAYYAYNTTSFTFTSTTGITAYSFPASPSTSGRFIIQNGQERYYRGYIRTFFGRAERTGYITFNQPLEFTIPSVSPSDTSFTFIFNNIVIGLDDSIYLSNFDNYIQSIDSNVSNIQDYIEEDHDTKHDFLDNGGSGAVGDALGAAYNVFSFIRSLFGLRSFFNLQIPTYTYTESFWTTQAHNYINPNITTRSDDGYIDFYVQNKNHILGVDED